MHGLLDRDTLLQLFVEEERLKTAAREHLDRAFGELRAARTANDSA